MKTKEENGTRNMTLVLSFVSVLVFCSFVVSRQLIDILYFLILISYMTYSKVRYLKNNEGSKSTLEM